MYKLKVFGNFIIEKILRISIAYTRLNKITSMAIRNMHW